jgi:hypothetical protein
MYYIMTVRLLVEAPGPNEAQDDTHDFLELARLPGGLSEERLIIDWGYVIEDEWVREFEATIDEKLFHDDSFLG